VQSYSKIRRLFKNFTKNVFKIWGRIANFWNFLARKEYFLKKSFCVLDVLVKPWFLLIFTLWFFDIFSLSNHILIITENFWWILRFFDKFMRPIEKIKMDLTDVISRLAPGSKLDSKIFRNLLLVSKISFHHMIISFTRYIEFNFCEQCKFLRKFQNFSGIPPDWKLPNFKWNGQFETKKEAFYGRFWRKSILFRLKLPF